MMKNKIFIFFPIFVFIFLLNNVNAGLVLNQSSFYINKTVGTTSQIILTVINTENFNFKNVSFEDNPYLVITPFDINAGQTVLVTATILTNSQVSKGIKLKGYYLSNLGKQYKNYYINVTSQIPLNLIPCDFSITEGDRVSWENKLLYDSITMRTENQVPVEGSTIQLGESFILDFSTPKSFTYYWTRFTDFPTSPVCTISILSSSGLINNPELDATLNITINQNYVPTILSTTVLNSNFSVSFTGTQDGLMSITNTGNTTAYNIHLAGDWFSFNINDFNLNLGETKGLIFTISPLIFNTNDTNKSFQKNIVVSGNFNTIIIPINIYINYADINSNSSNSDANYLLRIFCPQFPNSILCNPNPKVEYRYIYNSSDRSINISITEQQVRDLWSYMFQLGDDIKTYNNFNKGQLSGLSDKYFNMTDSVSQINIREISNTEKSQSTINSILIFIIIVFLSFSSVITFSLIYIYKNKKKLEELRIWN